MASETRVALVTGAQQGIGAAAARALAAAGHDVAINWLDDQAQAESIAADIRASGRKAALIRGDVGSAAGAAARRHLVPDLVGGVRRLHRERHLAAVVEMCRRRRNGAARLVQERRRQRRAHARFGRLAAG